MINKFTAEKAAKISQENELPMLIKKIDNACNKGLREVTNKTISEKTISELTELGYKISQDENQEFYIISW